ncbi:MAG: hypothetical protein WCK49_04910 [Myxococcaceae bacterium]
MRKKIIFSIFVFISCFANATKSENEKNSEATDIVIGVVKHISHHDLHNTKRLYSAQMELDTALKGYKGESWEITVTYWKSLESQGEQLGSQGQNGHLNIGDRVKLWLDRQNNGTYRIIEPNGIEWF